jgi:hypothetical protein
MGPQTMLKINEPGDAYEQEADSLADQVLATPVAPVGGASLHIQRFSGRSTEHADAAPASVDRALASPGRPLESALQQYMEAHFGHDFSRVRVHSDAAAEQLAQEIDANAYTLGQDIAFDSVQFVPGTNEGRHLLALELAHVVQQSGSVRSAIQRAPAPAGRQPSEGY